MSVAAMAMCVAYVLVRKRFKVEVAGAFVAPLALTTLLASRFVGNPRARRSHQRRDPSTSRRTSSASRSSRRVVRGDALPIQEHLLKTKQIDGVFRRLPALDVLDRAEYRFLLAGFPPPHDRHRDGHLWARRRGDGRPERGAPRRLRLRHVARHRSRALPARGRRLARTRRRVRHDRGLRLRGRGAPRLLAPLPGGADGHGGQLRDPAGRRHRSLAQDRSRRRARTVPERERDPPGSSRGSRGGPSSTRPCSSPRAIAWR